MTHESTSDLLKLEGFSNNDIELLLVLLWSDIFVFQIDLEILNLMGRSSD